MAIYLAFSQEPERPLQRLDLGRRRPRARGRV